MPDFTILADENIPLVDKAFSALGRVRGLPGRRVTRDEARDADILLVRSITPVNAALLQDSRVRFVGTATIGVDHVDQAYLARRDIGFAHAPGSNATSAAEYVMAALFLAAEHKGLSLDRCRVGIIGYGNVGSRVAYRLRGLGADCLIHDPPLQQETDGDHFVSLEQALRADIVSLHVPLIHDGQWPTANLADAGFFDALSPEAIFINTSRGAVVDETALLAKLKTCPNFTAILDVWRDEPRINPELLDRVFLGSAHIAGYSLDGKLRGTEMIYRAACQYFGHSPSWRAVPHLPPPDLINLEFSPQIDALEAFRRAILACYDPRRDDAALRRAQTSPQPGEAFDQLRKYYPPRREFAATRITVPAQRQDLLSGFRGLGFAVS